MNERQTIFDRFQQMPKAIQWAAYAALGLIVFLFWSDYIAPASREYSERAARITSNLETVRNTAAMNAQIATLGDTIAGVGEVQRPRPAAEGQVAMNRAVNEVLREHTISNDSFDVRIRGTLPRGSLPGLTGGVQPQRLNGVLRFNASPEVATSIIAALESRPEIESIISLDLNRIAGRRVSVQMTIEAWVLPTESTRRGGSV